MKLGLYGGSFDPLHQGHLIGALDALEQCQLDHLVLIPCAQSPHKLSHSLAPAAHRLRMIKASLKGYPALSVSDLELRRSPPSFTIDTVEAFAQAYPQAQLYWLIGSDQLSKLHTWHRIEIIRRLVTFLVLDRPGSGRRSRRPGVIYLPQPRPIAISSTEIRRRVQAHLPVDHLVPAPVARYLNRHPLYSSCPPKL
jgi:nicotinate-nucleotide adenylyltransferase